MCLAGAASKWPLLDRSIGRENTSGNASGLAVGARDCEPKSGVFFLVHRVALGRGERTPRYDLANHFAHHFIHKAKTRSTHHFHGSVAGNGSLMFALYLASAGAHFTAT